MILLKNSRLKVVWVMGQRGQLRYSIGLLAGVLVLLAACAPFDATTPMPTTTPGQTATPLPVPPAGDYAYVWGGNIWLRLGISPAVQITTLGLSDTVATWGPLVWSPGHARIAFVLRDPPLAQGDPSITPAQGTGSLYILDVSSHALVPVRNGSAPVLVPLMGRHLAWIDDRTLLYTSAGGVYQLTLNAQPTITPVSGPQFVWEIAVRGDTLYYSAVPDALTSGTGTAELDRLTLSSGATSRVATLGPVTLPSTSCPGFVCPADLATPYIPYGWDVSAQGTTIVYQSTAPAAPPLPPTVTATTTPVAAPTVSTPSATAVATATAPAPGATITTPTSTPTPSTPGTSTGALFVIAGDAAPRALPLAGLTLPNPATLALAPDGASFVTTSVPTRLDPDSASAAPILFSLQGAAPRAFIAGPTGVIDGEVSWAPDGSAFTLLDQPLANAVTSTSAITYPINGTAAPYVMLVNAITFTWG